MAQGDKFLLEVADKALLHSSRDLDEIRYRQDILKDAIRLPEALPEGLRPDGPGHGRREEDLAHPDQPPEPGPDAMPSD